jgi:hypothetical protein
MSRWVATSTLQAAVPATAVWERAYADADAWPRWNAEIRGRAVAEPAGEAGWPGPWASRATTRREP